MLGIMEKYEYLEIEIFENLQNECYEQFMRQFFHAWTFYQILLISIILPFMVKSFVGSEASL